MISNKKVRDLYGIFLLVVVFLITGWGWMRFEVALRLAKHLVALPLVVPSWYLWVTGLAWGVAGTVLLLMWLFSDALFPFGVVAATTTFVPFWWIDHFMVNKAPSLGVNRPFWAVALAVLLALTWISAFVYLYFGSLQTSGVGNDSEAESQN